jgi:hypothetical protein
MAVTLAVVVAPDWVRVAIAEELLYILDSKLAKTNRIVGLV